MKTQTASISLGRLNKLHAAALLENVSYDAAALATARDTVTDIGLPPDAAHAATTVSDPSTVIPDATPRMRMSVSDASHVDVSNVADALRFNGATLNGLGTPKRRDPATVSPVTLSASDVPALLARAATLIAAAASATVNAPNRIGASPLDRMMFLCRAAERLIYSADRYAPGTRIVRAFVGGYNGTEPTRIRIASVAAALTSVTPDATISADACDPLIVAHLATRKTDTMPSGGYFARNVGTIDR